MKNVRQLLIEYGARIDQLEKDQRYTTEKLTKLHEKLNEKVGKTGNTMPPTPRPSKLRALDIGQEPGG